MKVVFLKDGYYKGLRAKGEICDMENKDIDVYEEFRTAKKYFGKKNIGENIYRDEDGDKSIEDFSLSELKKLCIQNELPNKGTKRELIKSLNENKSKK